MRILGKIVEKPSTPRFSSKRLKTSRTDSVVSLGNKKEEKNVNLESRVLK